MVYDVNIKYYMHNLFGCSNDQITKIRLDRFYPINKIQLQQYLIEYCDCLLDRELKPISNPQHFHLDEFRNNWFNEKYYPIDKNKICEYYKKRYNLYDRIYNSLQENSWLEHSNTTDVLMFTVYIQDTTWSEIKDFQKNDFEILTISKF